MTASRTAGERIMNGVCQFTPFRTTRPARSARFARGLVVVRNFVPHSAHCQQQFRVGRIAFNFGA